MKTSIKTTLYHTPTISLDTNVSYCLLNNKNEIVLDVVNYQCFSHITFGVLPKEAILIKVRQPIAKIPYSWEVIQLWIKEINEFGFFCSVELIDQTVFFTLEIKNFLSKHHMTSTLQLLRCLFEDGIAYVPDIYFTLIKNNPSINKFFALQKAHANLSLYKETSCSSNSNHMVVVPSLTFKNGITKDTLFNRFQKDSYNIFEKKDYEKHYSLHSIWQKEELSVNKY